MKVLVTGAKGMLGHDIQLAGERAHHELILLGSKELDITDSGAVELAIEQASPDAVFNCAAWTDVDGAQTHWEAAHEVNGTGAGNLGKAASRAGVPLLHVSTDYVFNGEPKLDGKGEPRPYVESDRTGPKSVYGESKLAGELEVLEASPRHLVVRTSWLFGVNGHNFVETMLRLAVERDAVQVVDDQVGSPTWTGHLAPALLGMLEREVTGLAHLAGSGEVSWNGFAKEIFRQAELECAVEPASTADLARPAPRPAYSVLGTERSDLLPMPDWRDGLGGYLAARAGMIQA
jgi:dTDP-4-dehydrorhamnose reductase